MSNLLKGFGLSGFRSFSADSVQCLAPLSKINLIAGQNNAGKSNILRYAQMVFPKLGDRHPQIDLKPLDLPRHGPRQEALELAVPTYLPPRVIPEWFSQQQPTDINRKYLGPFVEILDHSALRLSGDKETLWVRYVLEPGASPRISSEQVSAVCADLTPEQKNSLVNVSAALPDRNKAFGSKDSIEPYLFHVLSKLAACDSLSVRVATIDAFRQVRASTSDLRTHDGSGLIEELARLERPDIHNLSDRNDFESINRFVRAVLDDDTVHIEIPFDRRTIHVHRGKQVLPLENLGTGIHQVVILAAAATLLKETLVCLEEPEIHLHPILQRKLLAYLYSETSNQYLIATHSAHMLDANLGAIFHVTMESDSTAVSVAATPDAHAQITADLGYRASDIVQSNAVIWVEGPSDRVYIKAWMERLYAPGDLIEGVHYSIMFYGGGLLRNLSAADPDVDEFISLRRLNRNLAIVIDSDRTYASKSLNETKRRVIDDFNKHTAGNSWVTAGYTIENYVPAEILLRAVKKIHPKAASGWGGERYENPLGKAQITGIAASSINKTAVAREVVGMWADDTEWLHGLKQKISRLVAFVREANDLH